MRGRELSTLVNKVYYSRTQRATITVGMTADSAVTPTVIVVIVTVIVVAVVLL